MRLREKGKTDGEIISMGWDEAQAALAAGTHEVAEGSETDKPKADDLVEKPTDDGLDNLTRAELAAQAGERGLEVSAAATKADIVKALRASR